MKIQYYSYYDLTAYIIYLATVLFHFLSQRFRFSSLEKTIRYSIRGIYFALFAGLISACVYFYNKFDAAVKKAEAHLQKFLMLFSQGDYRIYKFYFNYEYTLILIGFASVVLCVFLINFINKKIDANKYLSEEFENSKIFNIAFLFFLLCLLVSFSFKLEPVYHFFSRIISTTYARRFQGYGGYSVILLSLAVYYWFCFIKNSDIDIVTLKRLRRVFAAGFVVLAAAGAVVLFTYHTSNDRYNHSYIMRDDNVFSYINKNVPSWSVICSYAHPALEITSQTPNYVICVHGTHQPPVRLHWPKRYRDQFSLITIDRPMSEYLNIAGEYSCEYIMIETDKEFSKEFGLYMSLCNAIKKLTLLPEVFNEMYRDDKYLLIKINKDVDLKKLQSKVKTEIDKFISSNKTEEAYDLSAKLLMIERSAENYAINERLRRSMIDINPQKAALSYSFSFLNIPAKLTVLFSPYELHMLLDKAGYPSISDKIYIEAKCSLDKRREIKLTFGGNREISRIVIDWLNFESRAIDFSISCYSDGLLKELASVTENKESGYTLIFAKPVKMSAFVITVGRAAKDKIILKSLEIL